MLTFAGHAQVGLQQSCIVVVVYPDRKELSTVVESFAAGFAAGRPWSLSLHPVTRVKVAGHSTRLANTFQFKWYWLSTKFDSMHDPCVVLCVVLDALSIRSHCDAT